MIDIRTRYIIHVGRWYTVHRRSVLDKRVTECGKALLREWIDPAQLPEKERGRVDDMLRCTRCFRVHPDLLSRIVRLRSRAGRLASAVHRETLHFNETSMEGRLLDRAERAIEEGARLLLAFKQSPEVPKPQRR